MTSTVDREQIIVRNSDDIIRIIDSGRLTPKRAKLITIIKWDPINQDVELA